MKIQIVIPVINLFDKYTKPMLCSIKSKHDLRIFFIDNGSTDNTPEQATKLISDKFHYQRNEKNDGVSSSWNLGMRDAFINHQMDYCLIANNDILLHPNAIDRLVERFEKKIDVINTSNSSIDWSTMDGNQKDESIVMVTCHNAIDDFGRDPYKFLKSDDKEYEKLEENEHPDYSCFMVNRKYFDEVGEFDEGFNPAFYEDNDSHRRLKLAGLKAIKYPPSIHFHWGSRTQNEAIVGRHVAMSNNSHVYFKRKWGGDPDNDNPGTDKLFLHPFNDEKNDFKFVLQNDIIKS
jgi:GT2 family glycosyltransferase